MKKLFVVLSIILFAFSAHAWTLNWNDVSGEDGYIVRYKNYPVGYSYPSNPAPDNLIQDMSSATIVNLAADTVQWDLPVLTENNRYVFFVQATTSGSVSHESDYLCWTWPPPAQVIEADVAAGGGIQVNIYQKP